MRLSLALVSVPADARRDGPIVDATAGGPQPDLFERRLIRVLHDLANEPAPEYHDDLFWQTARTSQRSAWTVTEWWLR
jgi:hypothetical protein